MLQFRIAFSLRQKMVDSALSRSSTTHYPNPVWGQEKGERNASLLMAAPGLEEGRDRGRGEFNEGNGRGGGGEGEGEADSLAPQLFGKTHRLLWKTQDVGMQAGRTGLAIPPPNRPHTHTHTHTHTQFHSLHSSLNPFLPLYSTT